MKTFGKYIRDKREELLKTDRSFTVRKVAAKVGFEPSFLSKVERDEVPPPSEAKVIALAHVLGEDPDVLLALSGKVSSDLREAIMKRPRLFADLIRQLKDMPDQAVVRVVREVRDGKW
jgi:HTH-type transcriptional regulator, competence development regulator